MYDSIPPQIRAQIIRSCNKYGISSPEDVETAYNNFTQGKSIFENLSDSFYRAQDFKKFLEGGVIPHKYSGEDEPTGKMTISKLNKKSIVPVSVWHTPKGYTYNLPEVTVTPQSNPDDMLKMRRAINQGMNTAGRIGAEALSYASMAPAFLAAPGATLLGLAGGAAGASTGAKIGEYIAGDEGVLYGGLTGGLIGGGLGTGLTSPKIRSFMSSPLTGKYTKFGNREYRLSPNALGTNGGVPESRGLPDALQAKGWTIGDDGVILSPEGKRFIRNTKGRLQSESSLNTTNETIKNKQISKEIEAANRNKAKKVQKTFDSFYDESGLDFSTKNWESLAKGHKMSDAEKKIYEEQAFPAFMQTYRKLTNPNGFTKLKKENGKWYGWFNEPVSENVNNKLPVLKNKWDKGFRELKGDEGAMTYIIANSPQGEKLFYNGIPMYEGVPEKYVRDFISGRNKQAFQKWFDSNITGASAYSNPEKLKGNTGLQFYGLPIKPSKIYPKMGDDVRLIKREITSPSSNNWNGAGQPIGSFIGKNPEKKIHISEGPLRDDLASKYNNSDVNGVFTIVGEDIPVKSVFGGTGMYNIEGANLFKPFASLALPLGLMPAIKHKTTENDKKTKN